MKPSKNKGSGKELEQKVRHYALLTKKALGIVSIQKNLDLKERKIALDFLDMAKRYFDDARYFRKKGELLTALAAFSYAHAWLDAGVRAAYLDGKNNDQLFVLP